MIDPNREDMTTEGFSNEMSEPLNTSQELQAENNTEEDFFPSVEPSFEEISDSNNTEKETLVSHCPEINDSENNTPSQNLVEPSWVTELKNSIETLSLDFQRKLKYDATKQTQIDQLYKENAAYKENQIEKFKKQLVLAVIAQIDSAEKSISHYEKQDQNNVDDLLVKYEKLLKIFKELTEDFRSMLLEQFDISYWQSEPCTTFDPSCQRVLKKISTGNPALDKKLCESIRYGYRKGEPKENGSLIRPEIVSIYTFNANLVTENEPCNDLNPTGTDNEQVDINDIVTQEANNEGTDSFDSSVELN